jgi:Uma2 family endonuclease
VRAVLVNASESLVEHRRLLGIDKKDERWQGEWHFVNPPKQWHARLNTDLLLVLAPLARRAGLDPYTDNIGIFADPEQDWRIPDQAYARTEDIIDEGLSRAELVVEIHSQGDESHEKLDFYAAQSVREVLIVHEDRRVELHRLGDDGGYVLVSDGSGAASAVLGVRFTPVNGPRLRIEWTDGTAEI